MGVWWASRSASCWPAGMPTPTHFSVLRNLGDKKVRATIRVQKGPAGLLLGLGLLTLAVPFLSWDSSRTLTRAAVRRTNNVRVYALCSYARIARRGGEEGWR